MKYEDSRALPPKVAGPNGYSQLARRLTGWTTNLLATAIVLAIALGGGRQLVRWYQEDPVVVDGVNEPSYLALPAGEPVALELGGNSGLRRQVVQGSAEAAASQLQRFCREVLSTSAAPVELASPSEQRFLAALSADQMVDEAAGHWQIYYFQGLAPIGVGVRQAAPHEQSSESPLAEPLRRVLAWGMAVPSGQDEWILYQYQVTEVGARGAPRGEWLHVPHGSHRTLTITGPRGDQTVGIAGKGQPADWQQHFDRNFTGRGWQSKGWRKANADWHARYERHDGRVVEVHFALKRQSQLTGLVIIGPDIEEK